MTSNNATSAGNQQERSIKRKVTIVVIIVVVMVVILYLLYSIFSSQGDLPADEIKNLAPVNY